MPGLYTNGLTVATPANYNTNAQGNGELPVDTYGQNGVSPQTIAYPIQAFGQGQWTALTAAGTTQLGATAITTFKNLITVAATASTHGVRLPTAATGLAITVANAGAFGVKVYPPTNGTIQAVATNGADGTVLAVGKMNTYIATNTTHWIVQRGA